MRKKLFLLFAGLCVLANLNAQDKEFWFSASDVAVTHGDAPMFFVFTNPGRIDAQVTIEYWGGQPAGSPPYSATFTVDAGGYKKWDIASGGSTPAKGLFETPAYKAGTVSNYGIHITSTQKILAYYMVNNNVQRDIYSLKGAPALGKKFITPFMQHAGEYFEQRPSAKYNMGSDEIEIVATEDNTIVKIDKLTKRIMKGTTGTYYNVGETPSFTMNRGETLTLREDTVGATNTVNDIAATKNNGTLAGTMISSNKPIAVTQTEDCLSAVSFSRKSGNTDLVGDQLVPEDMVGKRYVVLRGHSTVGDRVDFVAINDHTTIKVYYWDGTTPAQVTSPTLNRGEMWHVDMTNLTGVLPYNAATAKASDIFVDATEPVYCYQHSATLGELGGAIIPSMYSISQQQISFYQSNGAVGKNNIFLVFRTDCDTAFTISIDGGPAQKFADAGLVITPKTIPSHIAGEWKYANVTLDNAWDNHVVTIKNETSTFSLGYFNGVGTSTAGYGYLSGFGSFAFDPDTFWRCADNPQPVTLVGGYALSYRWSHYPDTGYTTPTATWTSPSIRAREKGMYVLEMNQDPRIIRDTVWVLDMKWNASIKRQPNKPAKIGVPQQFSIKMNQSMLNMPTLRIKWTFEGGTPSTSVAASPKVVWNSTGQKKVTLHLSATAGTGAYEVTCDTTLVMDLMLHEKHLGYFVDRNVRGGRRDGTNWPNAFPTIDEALGLASQGDCIWVAEGNYMPPQGQSYVIDYDSVEIYGGFGAWETDLNERNYTLHKTIMNGNGSNVVVFDGSTNYTNNACGVSRDARVDGFIIRGGEAADGGGILFKNGASGTVANSIITSNTATNLGGGIHISGGYNGGCMGRTGDALIYNTEISHNRATTAGGGIYNSGSAFLSVNNTVSGNIAPTAGGLYNNGGDPHLRNSILWGNLTGGALGSDVMNEGGTPVWSHCNVGGWSATLGKDGGRNIDRNPVFRRKGYDDDLTPRSDGNYRLSSTSPSVNSGYNPFVLSGFRNRTSTVLLHPAKAGYTEALGLDLGSLARIYDDIVDMGAYEYHPNTIYPNVVHEIVIGTYPNVTTVPGAGIHYIESQKDFTMTLTPVEGYSLKYIQVKTDSKTRDEQQGGIRITHNEDGTVTLVFPKVVEPLTIQLTGVSPVSNVSIDRGYALRTEEGALHIRTAKATDAQIYSVTGQLVHRTQIARGETSIPLAKGVYIVTLDGQIRQKVVIR